MEYYVPRKLKFKAWNKESKLLMRLDSISCTKGELIKKDHILLQYTGFDDKQGDELYELDVVLMASVRYVIQWSVATPGWVYGPLGQAGNTQPLSAAVAGKMVRLWSYFESSGESLTS